MSWMKFCLICLFSVMNVIGCSSLFYYPRHDLLYNPQKLNLMPEDIWIKQDGMQIHAWLFKPQPQDKQNAQGIQGALSAQDKPVTKENEAQSTKGTFVFFHGNAENLTSHYLSLVWLLDYNYSFIIFDYPGYGQSEGTPTPESTVKAGKLVLEWVHKNLDSRPLYVYGQSLGGIISLRTVQDLKGQVPVKKLIVDSSFNSYQKIGRRALSRSWITWLFQPLAYILLSDNYAPNKLSMLSPIPLLFIHGDDDRTVESIFSKEMYSEALEPKTLWIIPKSFHGGTFYVNKGEYRAKLIDHLEL